MWSTPAGYQRGKSSLRATTPHHCARHISRFLFSSTELDELGYLNLKSEQVNAFFRLMDQRYGRVSTIITTNLDYPAWYALFDNKPLVDALLDRLQHHCITIRIDGPSLRTSAAAASPEPPSPSPNAKPRPKAA